MAGDVDPAFEMLTDGGGAGEEGEEGEEGEQPIFNLRKNRLAIAGDRKRLLFKHINWQQLPCGPLELHSATKTGSAEGGLRVWQCTDSKLLNIRFQYRSDPKYVLSRGFLHRYRNSKNIPSLR